MATPRRLKGQEVFVSIIVDNKEVDKFGPFLDLDVTLRLEVLEADYLGETTTAFDNVFRGCQLALKGHMIGGKWIKITNGLIKKSRNIAEGAVTRLDMNAAIVLPTGQILNWTFRDLTSSDIKVTVTDRKSYVEGALDLMCSDEPSIPNNL